MTMIRGSRILLVGSLAALFGCTPAPPIDYYMLTPVGEQSLAPVPSGDLTIGLQPIELADYLDRPEIVTRPQPTAVELADVHRWGERLDILIARVLAENLNVMAPASDVVLLPTPFVIEADRELLIEIGRFDMDDTGTVVLEARWQLVDSARGRTLASSRSRFTEDAGSTPSYEAIAIAMSRALGALSGEIAQQVR
jgi:uncharacterized protein